MCRIRGAAWDYFLPGHVVYWSQSTMRRALTEVGFRVERVSYGHADIDFRTLLRAELGSPNRLTRKVANVIKVLVASSVTALNIPMTKMWRLRPRRR